MAPLAVPKILMYFVIAGSASALVLYHWQWINPPFRRRQTRSMRALSWQFTASARQP
jgi:hypothetical protein